MRTVLFLALAVALPLAFGYSDRGVLYLDDLTFDKIIDGSRNVVVRFDKEYAWGDEHDAFKEVAKRVGESGADVLVASVPLSKREYDNHNAVLGERFGVQESDYPVYRIFSKGQIPKNGDKGSEYKGDKKKADAVVQWVALETGAFFGLKGQLKEFDALARTIDASSSAGDRKKAADSARKLLTSVPEADKGAAEYYVKVFDKLSTTGDYVVTESKRLKKFVDDKAVTKDKKDAFQAKLNALASFSALTK